MKMIRKILGAIILFINGIFVPKSQERSAEQQVRLDALTENLTLYQFKACPFCVKVRRAIKRFSLNIECVDINLDKAAEQQLISEAGKRQVPCLRIEDENGESIWLYESSAIVQYLQNLIKVG